MNRLKALAALAGLISGLSAHAQSYNIPPVSEAVCAYCEARITRGEDHKTWCPSYRPPRQEQESSGGSYNGGGGYYTPRPASPSTAQIVAGTMMPIIGQMIANDIINGDLPHLSERPVLVNTSAGGSNGPNNVVYDERSQRKGIWNNDKRNWLLKPYWYDDLIINDMHAVIALKVSKKNGKRWGIINPYSGRTLVEFEFGSIRYFTSESAPVILFIGPDQQGPCKLYVPDEGGMGYHMMDKEFEDARPYRKGDNMYVTVKEEGKWGVVGRNGAYIAEPAWEGIVPCGDVDGEEAFLTRIQTGWGLQIGQKEVLPHNYEWLSVGSRDVIFRPNGGKTGVCTLDGRPILQPSFDKVERYTSELAPGMNFYKVTSDGRSGLFTDDGVLAVPPLYTGEKELEIAAATCQTQSYSQYVKRLVEHMRATKDEFETSASFEARKADPAMQEKYIAENIGDTGAKFVAWSLNNTRHDRLNGYKLSISEYDADKGCFTINDTATPRHNPYTLYVPLDKARQFKEEFASMGKAAMDSAQYVVNMDTLAIGRMDFTMSDGSTFSIITQ